MPYYNFSCDCGHVTEARRGYDETTVDCEACGATARRVPVYREQFTITETGAVQGRHDRTRRNHLGEKLELLRRNSVETKRETGTDTGPFKLPESRTYGPK